MHRLGCRNETGGKTRFPGSFQPIGLFEIEPVGFIHGADALPRVATDREERAAQLVAFDRSLCRPDAARPGAPTAPPEAPELAVLKTTLPDVVATE